VTEQYAVAVTARVCWVLASYVHWCYSSYCFISSEKRCV